MKEKNIYRVKQEGGNRNIKSNRGDHHYENNSKQ